jgi:hypothetical protein
MLVLDLGACPRKPSGDTNDQFGPIRASTPTADLVSQGGLRFGCLADCVEAAVTGKLAKNLPDWLL